MGRQREESVPPLCYRGPGSNGPLEFPPPGGGGLKTLFDPTGWGIQMDIFTIGNPNDCNSQVNLSEVEFPPGGGGKYNPACTTDTSQCGAGPSPGPSPPPPHPSPSPTPGAHCDQCSSLIHSTCEGTGQSCAACAKKHSSDWTPIGCMVRQCPAEVSDACNGATRDILV